LFVGLALFVGRWVMGAAACGHGLTVRGARPGGRGYGEAPPPEPGGDALLVVDGHGTGFTWPTSLTAWEQHACTVAGRNLTRAEWTRYLPGQPYTRVCP
jgi:hypothetical protein